MGGSVGKREAEIAVEELRLFISLHKGAELHPESRRARQLAAARRAVAAYEAVQQELASQGA